ncbi:DUF945 family protein [Thioalkalivibrio thiocyanodenitrificans]|uniref:DUF945 family protein n=1 Tax=Thioalkalivibrio thiocyanodenitrificans TaxID=243063 RepID=UPI0003699F41|nr:DUF945 family protein [Thioalkalivibrio thiocyanodenitrificans]
MKRKYLVPILVIATFIAAWPAWLGWQADRQLAAYQGGRVGDLMLAHSLELFDRGWFRSTATSRMEARLGPEVYRFAVRHRVHQGFDGLTVTSEPVYPPEAAERLRALFGEHAPLSVTTRLGPLGDSAEIHVYSPAFSGILPDNPGTHVQSAGLEGTFHVHAQRLDGQIHVPEFTLADGEGRLTLRGQVLELNLADPASRLADARVEYRLDTLDAAGQDGQAPVRVERLRVRSSQARNGEYLDLAFQMGFGAVTAAGWETSQGDIGLRLGPLHAATFDALLRELEQVQGTGDGEITRGERGRAVFLAFLPAFLSHSPELALDPLRVQTPRGSLELALGAGFDGRDPEGGPDELARIRLTGRLQASRALAEELAGVISLQTMAGEGGAAVDPDTRRLLARPLGRGILKGLREEGYVRADGDSYRTDLRVEQGRLSINDVDRSEWLYLLLAGLIAPDGFN